METLLIDILKSGSIAFLGSKITRALQQKEISEILEASGWSIVGIDIIKLIIPIVKWIEKVGNDIGKFNQDMNGILDKLSKLKQGIFG